jgi:hypothetical protein
MNLFQWFKNVALTVIGFFVSLIMAFFRKGIGIKWPLLIIGALASFILGYSGFTSDLHLSKAESVYRSLLLFFLEGGSDLEGLKLQVARFLAAGVAVYTIILTLLHLFYEHIRMVQPRLWKDHVIIAGLGSIALKLIKEYQEIRKPVVVIERNENNENASEAERSGAIVLFGDATDAKMLEMSGVCRADSLIAACKDDGTNFEIVYRASQIVDAASNACTNKNLQASVHFLDAKLVNIFLRHSLITRHDAPIDVGIFNMFEYTARRLFQDHPLDRQGPYPDDAREVHLMIVGFGRMGEALFKQAAIIGHFANEPVVKTRLTVIDKNADLIKKKKAHFESLKINTICNTKFIPADIEDNHIQEYIAKLTSDTASIPSLAICNGDEHFAALCAVELSRKCGRDCPVYVYISKEKGLASLLTDQTPQNHMIKPNADVAGIHPFGMIDKIAVKEAISNDQIDRSARKIFEDYGKTQNNPLRTWEKAPEWEKISNRSQADHIDVKLRAIGCYAANRAAKPDDIKVSEFNEKEIELMAQMEHARWNAERFLNGWEKYDGSVPWHALSKEEKDRLKNDEKINGCLVDWDELPDHIKEFDRNAVKSIFAILKNLKQWVYRKVS